MVVNQKWIKLLCLFGIVLMMQGCKSEQQDRKEREELANRTLSTTTYNYTKYEIYHPNFMNENEKFDITTAAPADSVFSYNSGLESLEDGQKVRFSSGGCCFIWGQSNNKPVKLRVVWSVVYDLAKFEGDESKNYDDRKSKEPQPGSAWCEGTVEIVRPYPARPSGLFLHFFADGTLAANFGERGSLRLDGPRPLVEVKNHSAPLPQGTYCLKTINNPLYGIPRKPHME